MAQVYYDNDSGQYFYYQNDDNYYNDLVEDSDENVGEMEFEENNNIDNNIKPVPNAKVKRGKHINSDRRKHDSGIDNGRSTDNDSEDGQHIRTTKSKHKNNESRSRRNKKKKEESDSESSSESESTSSSSGYSSESSSESSSSE